MKSCHSTSVFTLSGVLALLALATPAFAQEGGVVTSGGATISTPTPTVTQIDQVTNKVVINWSDFSIVAGSAAIFNQPSATSIALNKVTGIAPSSILGSLQANGQVWILNPNGILFGQNATINVGALMASTLSLSDNDFMSGNYHLLQDPSKPASYVVNQGSVTATSFAALIAPLVENSGSITSNGGQVYLLGTGEAVLDIQGSGLVGYSIGSVTGQTVHIREDAVSDIVRAAVNVGGLVEAGSIVEDGSGVVRLVGAGGLSINTGTISVAGSTGVSGGQVVMNSTNATLNVHGASIDASGSGLASSGGSILLLSKDDTYFRGTLTATGGTTGDGGFIEVSGANQLWYLGMASASPQAGANGTVVIDPLVLTIINGAGPGDLDGALPDILVADTAGADTVSEAALEAITAGTDIILEATDLINMDDLTTDGTLTLSADSISFETMAAGSDITFDDVTNSIVITGPISFTSLDALTLGNLTSTNNTIDLVAGGDINFNTLNAGTSAITIVTTGGEILQTGGTVTANLLDATADTGITIVDSDVNNFTADNGTGAVGLLDNAGPLTLDVITNGGGVTILTNNNLLVDDDITATGFTVTLTSTLGSISQTGGTTITGTNLFVTGDDGITLGDVAISNLEAQNGGSGAISITNSAAGDLTLIDLGGGGTGAINTSGNISVITGGNLILEDNVSSVGFTTNLTAAGDITSTGGTVSATTLNLVSVGGVTLTGLTVTNLSAANTGGGGIDLADLGGVTINGSGVSNTGGGTVDISTTGSITITQAVSNAGGNAIDLTATGGGFTHSGGTVSTTGTATLTATSGAYNQTGGDISVGVLDIDATTGIALFSVSTSGDATITTTGGNIALNGAVTAGDELILSALGGAVTWSAGVVTAPILTIDADDGITVGSSVTRSVIGTLDADNNSTGNINVFDNGGFTVTVATTATGSIVLNSNAVLTLNGTIDTGTAGDITLAGTAITQSGGTILGDTLTLAATGNVSLGQTGTTLTVDFLTGSTGAGSLTLDNTAALELNNLTVGSGNIEAQGVLTLDGTVTSAGALTLDANTFLFDIVSGSISASDLTLIANAVSSGDTLTVAVVNMSVDLATGDLTINDTSGSLNVASGGIDVPGGILSITSTGLITQAATGTITAASLALDATGGIDLLSTTVDTLAATNAGGGAISIFDSAAGLTIGTVDGITGVGNTGNVTLSATEVLTLSNNVASSGTVTLISQNNSIGGTATVNATSLVLDAEDGILLSALNVTNLAAFNGSTGAITLTTAGAVNLSDAGGVTAISNPGRDIDITANGDLTLIDSILGGSVDLIAQTAGSSIVTNAGGTIDSAALTLSATDGITIGGAIVATGTITANTNTAGGISITANVNSGGNAQSWSATSAGADFSHTGGTITSGALTVTVNDTITNNAAISATGTVGLTATTGSISTNAAGTIGSGALTLNSATASIGGAVTATGAVNVTTTGAGGISVAANVNSGTNSQTYTSTTGAGAFSHTAGTITASQLTVNSGAAITNNAAITVTGPVALTATGSAITTNAAGTIGSGALTLNSATVSIGGAVTATGAVNVTTTAAGGITIAAGVNSAANSQTYTSTAGSGTFFHTAGTINGGTVTVNAGGTVTLSSTITSSTLSATSATGDILLTAAGTSVSSTGGMTLDSTLGLINHNSGTLSAGGLLTALADDGITLGGGASTLTIASLTADNAVSGNVSVADDTLGLTISGITNTVGTITVSTAGGGMTVTGNVNAGAANAVTLSATGGGFTQNAGTTITSDLLTISAQGAVTLAGISADGNVSVTTTTGTISVNGNLNAGANTVLLDTNAGAITQGATATLTSGVLDLDATTGITLTTVTAGGDITADTTGGPIAINGAVDATGFTVSLTTGANITTAGGTVTATDLVLSSSTGATLVTDIDSVTATNGSGLVSITDTALDLDVAAGGVTSTTGGVTLIAVDNLDLGGDVTAGGTATLTAQNGTILQNGNVITANTLIANAETALTLTGLVVSNLAASVDGSLEALTLDTTGAVTIVAPGLVTNDGNIFLDAGGNIIINGTVNSGANAVDIDATGSLTQSGGTVLAASAILNADTQISLTSGSIGLLQATNTTSGDISIIGMTGALDVAGGGVTNSAAGGDVRIATDGDLTLVSDVTVAAGGTVTLEGATIDQTTGTIVGATRLVLIADTDITLTAMDAIELAAGSGGGAITLDFTTDVTIVNDALLNGISNPGGTVLIDVPTGDFTQNGVINVAGGTITLTVPTGAILWTSGAFSAASAILTTDTGITLQTGAIVSLEAVTTAGDISITGMTGPMEISVNDVDASGTVSLASTGTMTVTGDILSGASDITLSAGNFVSNGGLVDATDLIANATTGGTLDNTSVVNLEASNAGGTLEITGAAGLTLTLVNGGLTGAGSITVIAGDSLDIDAPINLGGTANLQAAAAIVWTSGAITANTLMLDAGTTIDPLTTTIANLQATRATGAVDITNTGNLTVTGTGITGDGLTDLETTLNLIVNAPIAAGTTNDVTLTSTGGNVTGAGAITADTLTVTAAGSINLTNVVFNDFSFTAGTGITIVSTNTADVTIVAPGLTVAAGSISFTNTGNLIIDGDVSAPVNVTLASTTGSVTQNAGTLITAGATLTGNGATGVTFPDVLAATFAGANTTSGGISVVDGAGGLTLGVINAPGQTVTVTTAGFGITGTAAVTAGQLTLNADTGVSLSNVLATSLTVVNDFTTPGTSAGAVIITDAGGITVNGISNPGGTVLVSTSGTMSVAGPVDSGANQTTLTATGAGSQITGTGGITAGPLQLNSVAGVNLTAGLSVSTLQIVNTAGSVTFTNNAVPLTITGSGVNTSGAGAVLTISTNGDLTLGAGVGNAGNPISLTSIGGTLIQTGATALNGGALTLSAANGITIVSSTVTSLNATNSSGTVSVTDAGGLTTATVNNALGNVTILTTGILSGGSITGQLLTLTTTGGATLGAHNITGLTVTNNTSGNVSLTGGTNPFTVQGTGIVTPGTTTLAGTGTITISANIGTLNQNLTLTSTAGQINRTAGTLSIGTGTLSVTSFAGGTLGTAALPVTIANFNANQTGAGTLQVVTSGLVTINNLGLNGITSAAGGTVLLQTNTGTITIAAQLTGAGAVTLISGGGNVIRSTTISHAITVGTLFVQGTTSISMTHTAGTFPFTPGNLGGNVTISGQSLTFTPGASLNITGLTTVNGTISVSPTIAGLTVTYTGDVSSGTGTITLGGTSANIVIGSNVNITGSSTVTIGTLNSTSTITQQAGTGIISTPGTLNLQSVNGMTITGFSCLSIRISNLSTGAVSVTGGLSSFSFVTTVTAPNGPLTISTAGSITLNASITNTNQTTTITAGAGTGFGSIFRTGGTITCATLILNADSGITVSAGLSTAVTSLSAVNDDPDFLSTFGDINITTSTTSALNIVGSGLVNTGGNITLTTAGPILLDSLVTNGISNFPFTTTLTANGSITGDALIDAFRLNLSSVGGQNLGFMVVDEIQSTNTGSGATILDNNFVDLTIAGTGISNTVGGVSITVGDFTNGASLIISANVTNTNQTTLFDIFGGVILQTSGLIQSGTLQAFSDFGISLTNVGSMNLEAANFTQGPIIISSAGNLTLTDINSFFLGGNISVVTAGTLTASGSVSTTNGFIHMQSGGDFTATGSFTATTDVQLRAGGALNMGSTGVIDAPAFVDLDGVNVTLNDITAGGLLTVDAAGTLSIGSAGVISTSGLADFQAAGAVTIAGDVFAGGPITLSTAGTLDVSNGALLDSAVSISIGSGQAMTLSGAISTAGAFTANSGAGLSQGLTGTISAQSVGAHSLGGVLSLGGSITVTGNVEGYGATGLTQAGTGSIDAVNVTLNSPGDVALHLITGTGIVDVRTGAAGNIIQSTGSIVTGDLSVNFQAGNSVFLGGVGGGSILIMAISGVIADNNDALIPGTLNLASTGDVILVAHGSIGSVADPIEVDVDGTVTVHTNGVPPPAQIALTGTTGDGIIHIGSAPSGTIVFFNESLLTGGGNTDAMMNWYRDLVARGYDVWSQVVLTDDDTTQHKVIMRQRPAPRRAKTPLR